MPVGLDIELHGAQRAAAAAARDITSVFSALGTDIKKILGGSVSEGLKALGGASELDLLKNKLAEAGQAEFLLAQRAEAASVRSVAAWRSAEAAVDKYTASSVQAMKATASAMDASALATVAANKHTKSVEDSTAAHKNLEAAAAGSAGALGRFQTAATLASGAVVGGFVAAAASATKAAGDFQVQLTRLETVGGELPRNLKQIHDGLMQLASTTGWNPTELATGMLKVEQAGYRGTEALTVFKAAAQGAAEEGIGLDEAANAVTTTLHDYHLGADQAANVTSKMIEAVRVGKTTFAEFTGALHNVQPTASAVGESLNDLLATMGMLTLSGMHADQASDNLNHALSSLGTIQPKQREMLAALGLDPRQIPQDIRSKGYIGTAQEIRGSVDRRLGPNGNVILDAFENNPASQALEQEQYGKLSPNEQAVADRIMQGQLSKKEFRKSSGGLGVTEARIVDQWLTTHENNQGFNRVLKSLNTDQLGQLQALQTAVGGQDNARTLLQVTDQNNPEALQHRQQISDAKADPNGDVMEYKRSQQNFNAQWKDLKASMDALKIEFGEDFLPTATKWAKSLETGVHWMQQHRQLVKDLIEDVTVLSGLFLGMKLSTGLVNTVKEFKTAFGLTKKAVDETNTSLRESGPSAQAGSAGVKTASAEKGAAEARVKDAVYQANQELRNSGSAAQAGASGVQSAAGEKVSAENRVRTAAEEANAEMRGAAAAAEAGAAGVVAAANTEVSAMGRVISAAGRARGALAAVGGFALSMGGDALQANTRTNTNPNKIGVIASDAGNMAMAGGAIASIIPGVGTAVGAGIGGVLGAGYGLWDQYFSGDHDVAAPDDSTADKGPVPVVNQPTPDTSQPNADLIAPVPDTSQPEAPDTPYSGGGGGGNGKKPKDDDPLDEDLKRIERLQTEANEIQGRIADDKNSNDPARQEEIPWLQKKLDEIRKDLAGIEGKGKSGSSDPFMPVKLDDNWLQGGLSGLVRNTIGFVEDLVLGPLEVAAFGGIPDFDGANGKSGRNSRRSRGVRRSHKEGLEGLHEEGAEAPGGIPGGAVPVFVTNWASGGPGGPGGSGASFGGGGSSSGSAPGAYSGSGSASGGSTPTEVGPSSAPTGEWGLPGGGTDSEKWLFSHLAAAGFSASEIHGILAMNRVESGGSDMGMLGLTQGQAPSRDDKLATFIRQWRNPQGSGYHGAPGVNGQPPGVDANGNVVDSNQFLDWLSGAVEGQDALASDWQGNAQPADYRQQVRNQYNQIRPPAGRPAQSSASGAHNSFYKMWYGDGSSKSSLWWGGKSHDYHPSANMPVTDPNHPLPQVDKPKSPSLGDTLSGLLHGLTNGLNSLSDSLGMSRIGAPRPGFHDMQVPPYTPPPQKVPDDHAPIPPALRQAWGLPDYKARGGLVKYFGTGGPVGTDTVPAWLTPGETVMNVGASNQFGPMLQAMNTGYMNLGGLVPQYFDDGGGVSAAQQAVQNPGTPKPGASGGSSGGMMSGLRAALPGGQSQPPGPPGAQIPSALGPAGQASPGAQQGQAGNAAPTDAQHPEDSMPASSGIGFSGGLIGAAEGAASSAAGAAAGAGTFGAAGGAATQAMQIGFQELNRAAAYGAQAGGILAEGALESIMPSDGSTNWMQTIPGRLLSGVAGARPENPNTAGQTKLPNPGDSQAGGYAPTGGGQGSYTGADANGGHTFVIDTMHVNANDPRQLGDTLVNESPSMAENSHPLSNNMFTGRN